MRKYIISISILLFFIIKGFSIESPSGLYFESNRETENFFYSKAAAPNWEAAPNLLNNMSIIGKIQLSPGVFSLNGNDIIGAFVGEECRGVANPFPSQNGVFFLTVGSNIQSGEKVSFKIYLSATDNIMDASDTVTFQSNAEVGTMADPFIIKYSSLSVSPSNQPAPSSPSGTVSFTVTTNSSWTAISNQPWCTVTPSGTGNSTLVATYSVNTTTAQRVAGITVTASGLAPISVTVTQSGCIPPTAPVVGAITHPTCQTPTGSVVLSGLPASGAWTLTRYPGGTTLTGSGVSTTVSGLPPGTHTFSVENVSGCSSSSSGFVVINAAPSAPSAPIVGAITQPTCSLATGSVVLSGLPSSGSWTLTRTPGGVTTSGTGASTNVSGLSSGAYTFTVTNSSGCVSPSSGDVVIKAAPSAPTAPIVGAITQPTCSVATGSVVLSGLPSSGSWTLTRTPGGVTTSGTGASITISGLLPGTYTFTVTNSSGCISSASANVGINAAPTVPSALVVGAITQPTCSVATGSVELSGLPSSGSWTLTKNPGGVTTSGTGASTTVSGLLPGTYTFTVTNSSGCVSPSSGNVVTNPAPSAPTAPIVGAITQPTCSIATGSVVLSGLPSSGSWTLTRYPGGVTTSGTGASTTISGLVPGTYTFTVTNSSGCVSSASGNVAINAAPSAPSAPVVGAITQPTCIDSFGSVVLTGLPASGTWTITRIPGNVASTGTGTSTIISWIEPGTYNFTVSNSSGCTSPQSGNVVINPKPIETPPTVTINDPIPPIPVSFTVSLTFSKDVMGVETGVTGGTVIKADNRHYTVTLTGASNSTVTLTLKNTITDFCGNPLTQTTRYYTIGDFTAPAAISKSPAGILPIDDTTLELILTLSEHVVAGSGNLIVYKGQEVFLTFNVSNVTIAGNQVKVQVSLDKNSDYWVYVSPGFVKDATGNPFEGIINSTNWTFTTRNFATDINNLETKQFRIFPNPFNDYIMIENFERLQRVYISNIFGQKILDIEYPSKEISTQYLVPGIYYMTLILKNGQTEYKKVIKVGEIHN